MLRKVYLIFLCLLAVAMNTSVFVANMLWVLMGVLWLCSGHWKGKWQRLRKSRVAAFFGAFLVLLLLSLLWSGNVAQGLDELRQLLPLFVLPLVMESEPPLRMSEKRWVMRWYVATVWVVSVIVFVRSLLFPDLPYRDFYPYGSHIRFSLNMVFASVVVVFVATRGEKIGWIRWLVAACLIGWWVFVLVLLHSYTGLILGAVMMLGGLVLLWGRMRPALRWGVMAAVMAVVGLFAWRVYVCARDYYTPSPLAQSPLAECTVNGRPYTHARNGWMECGSYVDDYICQEELTEQWERRSALPVDSATATGYSVRSTLVRYLNVKGLAKDSVGLWALTNDDIVAIEQGVANPYDRGDVFRAEIYHILMAYDQYRLFHNVRDFSFSERVLLWRNALDVVCQHPVMGVGLGSTTEECHANLCKTNSQLCGTEKSCHNQYLEGLLTFGLVGFILLVFLFLQWIVAQYRAFVERKKREQGLSPLFPFFMVLVLLSFLAENTLGTLAGVLFVVFPLLLLCDASEEADVAIDSARN